MTLRFCTCDRVPPPGVPYTTAYCRWCYLWTYEAGFREAWQKEGAARFAQQKAQRPSPPVVQRPTSYADLAGCCH